jgi:hypothetical protein
VLFSEIASLRSTHDDMSAKPCDSCKMIMVNYADLWIVHSHVASLLDPHFWVLALVARCLDLI